jgi:hypothetical protein
VQRLSPTDRPPTIGERTLSDATFLLIRTSDSAKIPLLLLSNARLPITAVLSLFERAKMPAK